MSLTASPFDATTGALLPVYRDAYLRGDLSREHTQRVDAYLKQHHALGTQTWQRFHAMQQTGEQVQAVGWMQHQLNLARTAPQRTRRQAASLIAIAALVGGAVFAGTTTPTALGTGVGTGAPAEAASTVRMTAVHGKILDENGHPLAGATVLEKGTHRGVSTDAEGEYTLLVPANRPVVLAYGYGGYTDDEMRVSGAAAETMTLVPNYETPAKPVRKARHWFAFLR